MFKLNTEIYGVYLLIVQMRDNVDQRKPPYLDIFRAVGAYF